MALERNVVQETQRTIERAMMVYAAGVLLYGSILATGAIMDITSRKTPKVYVPVDPTAFEYQLNNFRETCYMRTDNFRFSKQFCDDAAKEFNTLAQEEMRKYK